MFGVKTTNNGKINRSQLAEIVFNDKNALKRLVRILNPFLIKEINSHTDENVIFIEAPTLFENGLQVYVDKIIMIGPKNSFKSWKDEFVKCFGLKKKLNVLNIQIVIYI